MKVTTSFPVEFTEKNDNYNVYRKRMRVEFSDKEYSDYVEFCNQEKEKNLYTDFFGLRLYRGKNYANNTQHHLMVQFLTNNKAKGYKRARYSMYVNCVIHIEIV